MNKPIQIVDKTGKAVGVAKSPFDAIAEGKTRLLVRVVITNGSDKFLLQKRATGMRMYPGCWDTAAAGHVDEGEDIQTAAYRELKEEIGLDRVTLQLQTSYYADLHIVRYKASFKSYNYVYTAQYTGPLSSLTLAADEVESVMWFTRHEIEEMIKNSPRVCTDGLLKLFGGNII